MVYGFVKQSGGHVKIYSEPGDGNYDKGVPPRSRDAEQTVVPVDTRPVVGGTETILVAEDDEHVRSTVVETLQQLGYQVLVAADAEKALAVVKSGIKVDLLFTDVVMPGPLRSPDLARKTRELLPGCAVLFTSGYTRNAIVHGGRLHPGVELLAKPYTREDLARKIRHALANHSQRGLSQPDQRKLTQVSRSEDALHILLVEDDDGIRATTAEMLLALGHTVRQASSGEQALEALKASEIDVLIVDVGLPGMSGTALAEAARLRRPKLASCSLLGMMLQVLCRELVLLAERYDQEAIREVLRQSRRKRIAACRRVARAVRHEQAMSESGFPSGAM